MLFGAISPLGVAEEDDAAPVQLLLSGGGGGGAFLSGLVGLLLSSRRCAFPGCTAVMVARCRGLGL